MRLDRPARVQLEREEEHGHADGPAGHERVADGLQLVILVRRLARVVGAAHGSISAQEAPRLALRVVVAVGDAREGGED